MNIHYKFYSAIGNYGDSVEIYIGECDFSGNVIRALDSMDFKVRTEGIANYSTPFRPNRKEAQQLFDSLWEIGLRPSKEIGNEGMKKAMTDHIEDMRYVVKKLLDK